MKNNNSATETSKKMYLTAAEAKGMPSMDEQIQRWNELQRQIREGR